MMLCNYIHFTKLYAYYLFVMQRTNDLLQYTNKVIIKFLCVWDFILPSLSLHTSHLIANRTSKLAHKLYNNVCIIYLVIKQNASGVWRFLQII